MITLTDKEQANLMLNVYFKTQAAIEKYLGPDRLEEWTVYVAKQFSDNIRETSNSMEEIEEKVVRELAEVLTVYGSDYEYIKEDGHISLDVKRCGIFNYRGKAQEKGVELTLKLPCEFCTDFRNKVAEQLNVEGLSYSLHECGCKWTKTLSSKNENDQPLFYK
ncbi:hypothetical protein [Rummeliibacillus pycnus]|uniref:hypothetical protein n=1 Tax=Rummeliibacillus pycnus TaxID=101070 RepID=UPI0037C6066D